MIRATIPMQIFVCVQPTDMRRSFDGLSGTVRQILEHDPLRPVRYFSFTIDRVID
ncbi:MAG: IS66 family insertion sequence element accessory protein TnpB [Planctomycetaceae bacterium]|nr:IS66 family insertion sequence element accessory protein TnpB [Planctomycetaceae bacterium]